MTQDNNQHFLNDVKRYSNPKIGFVFILAIILIFNLAPLIGLASQGDYSRYTDYAYLYIGCSYTIIVLGILIFQAHGLEILSDHFSLWLIICTCFVRTSLQGNHEPISIFNLGLLEKRELVYTLYLGFLGLVLSIYGIRNRKRFMIPSGNLVFVGIVWSIGTVLIIALTQVLLSSFEITAVPPNLIKSIRNEFLYNISFAGVSEEVCFRGLIVGFMIVNGYKEDFAFLVQAVLFWGIHYMFVTTNPIWFFTGIPLLTLSTTLIMKKYKTIFLPILVHTTVNVFIYIFVFLLQPYFS